MTSFFRRNKGKIFLSLLASPFLTAYGTSYYYFPELRNNQQQLFKAFIRSARIGIAGGRLVQIYMKVIV